MRLTGLTLKVLLPQLTSDPASAERLRRGGHRHAAQAPERLPADTLSSASCWTGSTRL